MVHRSPVAIASTSCKRFCVLGNKPMICPDIHKKTLLPFTIKAVLLLAKTSEEEAVLYALRIRKDDMSRRNAGKKGASPITSKLQEARYESTPHVHSS